MIAAAAAVIVALVFIPWQMKPTDFRKESLENFERIIAGQLTVAKATNSFDDLVASFMHKVYGISSLAFPSKQSLSAGSSRNITGRNLHIWFTEEVIRSSTCTKRLKSCSNAVF
jgi:hypothetical protein